MSEKRVDLFILAGEASGDLHGSTLITALLSQSPDLKISAMAGPKMRNLPIEVLYQMEELQVMGFVDVLSHLPKIAYLFYKIGNRILKLNPKAVVCIDYPGFNLRLESYLRKKGYRGKLIHYICPTVWAWGKKRIPRMAKTLDLLLTLFPFEKEAFSSTSLSVQYVGHPLTSAIPQAILNRKPILALFPGSRQKVIEKNLPLQLCVAKKIQALDPQVEIAISVSENAKEQIRQIVQDTPMKLIPPSENYTLMRQCSLAIATSGTVTLELALHETPTIVNYAIGKLDLFLAQKILRISLSHYCIVNILKKEEVFPEYFGPNCTEENLFLKAREFWFNEEKRQFVQSQCQKIRTLLGEKRGSEEAAAAIRKLLI